MPSIHPQSYTPPPRPPPTPAPPPPPIYQTMPDGSVREVDMIIVTAERLQSNPHRSLLPYGGLTGAQANSLRDMEFAMPSPEDRARML